MSVERVREAFQESARNFTKLCELAPDVATAAEMIAAALGQGGKVLFCGNGGSAADAQHLAAELVGRYKLERHPLPGIALTVDSSALTAIANDYGYDAVFERQVRGLGRAGDVLVGISTSGNSASVARAVEAAAALGMKTVGLTGEGGGRMAGLCDLTLRVPSADTPRIQEMHIAIGHMLCELVETALA